MPVAGLLATLHSRGLRGPTEMDALLRAVADARLSSELLRLLGALDPALLERFLSSRLVLLGDCSSCPQPQGQAVVRVPASRCSICQGLDLKAVRRRLVDACLVGGFTRLALVGGRGQELRFVRDLLGDARIELMLVPAGTLLGEATIADLRRASVVVEILGAGLPPDLQELELGCPRVQVESTAPGPLVEAIAAALRAVTG